MKGSAGMTRQLILFSIPLILSGVLQQLFNWADAFIVGNIVGESALAAVGATMYVHGLLVMAITGFTSGVSILSARMFGEGNLQAQKKILFTFLILLGAASLVMSAVGAGLAESALALLNTPADIFEMALDYLRICMVGVPFLAIYNVYAAVLRGVGDSRSPFFAVMVSVVGNALLDLVLVGGFSMGVAGAAWATVLSQVMMALFLMFYAGYAHGELRFAPAWELFDGKILKEGSALAAPITVQSVISSAGGLILQDVMNSFGTRTVAAISAAYRVDSLILLPMINLGTGISTLTAQNLGAGDLKQARRCLQVGTVLMSVVSVCLTGVVLLLGGTLISMFGVTAESTAIGVRFFHAIAWFYIVDGWAMSLRGYLEGSGDVMFSGVAGILSLGVRIVLSYAMMGLFDNMVIAYAEAFSWCFMLLLYLLRAVVILRRQREG